MPYTTPPAKSSGDILTAANWTSHLKGNLDFLHSPPGCIVRAGTAWVITAADVAITFGTAEEVMDTNGMHGAANPSRITVQTAGVYHVCANAGTITGVNDNTVKVHINGTFVAATSPSTYPAPVSFLWPAAVSDYFEMRIVSASGTFFPPSLSAIWIGATS